MAHNDKNLVAIDAGLFCEGMYLPSRLYYFCKEDCVLLCEDVLLTHELNQKIHDIANNQSGIFVEEGHYEEVWNESLRQFAQSNVDSENEQRIWNEKNSRTKEDFLRVACDVAYLLGEAAHTDKIPMPMVQTISQNIFDKLKSTDDSHILNCINEIRQVDDYLYMHCVNVASLSGLIGKWANLPETDILTLITIGLVHDLGKLKVPPEILDKPGIFTDEEFDMMKRHPAYSCELLLRSGETDPTLLVAVRGHHEKMNGKGYPDGLSGDSLPLFSRITAVSDVYDAMVSKRSYKEPITPFEVLAQFSQERFSNLDPEIVDIFLRNLPCTLVGRHVLLSNNEIGKVVYINPADFAYPVVRVDGRIVVTNASCKCISLVDALPHNQLIS